MYSRTMPLIYILIQVVTDDWSGWTSDNTVDNLRLKQPSMGVAQTSQWYHDLSPFVSLPVRVDHDHAESSTMDCKMPPAQSGLSLVVWLFSVINSVCVSVCGNAGFDNDGHRDHDGRPQTMIMMATNYDDQRRWNLSNDVVNLAIS